MAEHFKFSVMIAGERMQSVSGLHIHQSLFSHHDFEVVLPMKSVVSSEKEDDPFLKLQGLIGKDIEITLSTTSKDDEEGEKHTSVFQGLVTNLHVSGNRWEHAMLSIDGQSNTVLMDSIPDTRAYADLTIPSIFKSCVSKHLSEKIKVEDNITYTDKLRYTVQYGESDFDFMKRLCFEYGEWFYYDGENLCLGRNPKANVITIKRDRLQSLRYDYSLISNTPGVKVRDYNKNEIKEHIPKEVDSKDIMAKHSLKESKSIYPAAKDSFVYKTSHASGDKLQDELKEIKHKLDVANQVQQANVMAVSGDSDMADIRLGSVLKLEGLDHVGEFVVVYVSHNCVSAKTYSNHFRAIPKEAIFPLDINFKKPMVQPCTAQVSDNKDPKKWGRVRVKFDWSGDVESPWIRMASMHAGDTRGMYFVPEVGDDVMVGFEGGCPENPYVIGSLYNGEYNFSGSYDSDNNLKSIKTKSGNEILFDDTGKMILKNENNSLELHCESNGKIEIITNGDITLNAKKNLTMIAGGAVKINAGADMEISAGGDASYSSDGKTEIGATGDIGIASNGNVEVSALQNMDVSATQNASLSGMMTKIEAMTNAEVSGSAMTVIKGALVKIN
ncbi:MAG: type VI secretion system Vgr family protein [Cryomorphaceae bacterium]|nr:type VI secretion system tip protein VgrG [Flavobacteriales bacterium]